MKKWLVLITVGLIGLGIAQYYLDNKKEITGYNIEKSSQKIQSKVITTNPNITIIYPKGTNTMSGMSYDWGSK